MVRKDAGRLKRMCQKKWVFSLNEQHDQPTDPSTISTIDRKPGQTVAVVGQHLREKHRGESQGVSQRNLRLTFSTLKGQRFYGSLTP